jgi:uracil-DNA glycosylase
LRELRGKASRMTDTIKLGETWRQPLAAEFSDPYMHALRTFLVGEKAKGKHIFPKGSEWFRALDLTPLDQVRVVILGQDPYHGEGQAHGLCFSVQPGVRVPPSLSNIYKELKSDLGIEPAKHGHLEGWAQQGVLLLNSVLTVEMGQAASHQGKGWERFTDAVIRCVNAREDPVVFLLWGAYAQKKAAFVDPSRHFVLKAAHPSPLSAHNGFLGCNHFSQTNAFLMKRGIKPIDWTLPPLS